MTKQIQLDALALYSLIPRRVCSETALLSLEQDGITRENIQAALLRLQQEKHIRKIVIVESGKELNWKVSDWSDATVSERKNGNVAYQLTEDGFQYLRFLLLRLGIEIPLFSNFPLPFTDCKWGRTGTRTDTLNSERNKQSVIVMLRRVGVATPSEPRVTPPSPRSRKASPQTISDALEKKIAELSLFPKDRLTTPHFYLKYELQNGKNTDRDNSLGVLVSPPRLYPVYHTTSPLGTRWCESNKNEMKLTLDYTAAALGVANAETDAALMFYSKDQEIRDIVKSCHGEEVRRSFLRRKEIDYSNPASPFDHLYLVPENKWGASQIQQIFVSPGKDIYARILQNSLYEAKLRSEVDKTLVLLPRGSKSDACSVPDSDAEYSNFVFASFPYSAVLDDAPAVPVLLCYDLDLSALSRAYYWTYKTDRIGHINIGGERKRALLIGCYTWQIPLLQMLFPDAIYSAPMTQ